MAEVTTYRSVGFGQFPVTRLDPKRHAQEEAAKGNWKPTTAMLNHAEPDFVRRFFINEAVKQDLRRMYVRSVLIGSRPESGTSAADHAQARAVEFWQEYAALDNRWIGDLPEIKEAISKEKQ